ncbi:MAG: hypothetical protein H8F28_21745 [Fibrella sp.]|nr:hypothetical protein [Armatimonadota bacterium]
MFRLPFGKKPAELPSVESVVNEALALLKAGRAVDAEARMRRHIAQVEETLGTTNAKYAEAQAGYASLLQIVGKTDAALEAHRAAQEWEPPLSDKVARKDWLTFVTDFGLALGAADELDEAEATLRRGLQGRLDYYGREHPGYAFGLEPLVTILLRTARYEEALTLQDEVIKNFASNGHPRFLQALVILSAASVAVGVIPTPLAGFTTSDTGAFEQLASEGPEILTDIPHPFRQPVLLEIAELVAQHCGEANPARLSLLAQIVNNETEEDEPDHEVRISCARKLFAAYEGQKNYAKAGMALLGLAFAQGEAGDVASASQSYERARIGAERLGDFSQASSAERNHGLLLSSGNQESTEAETRLRNALALAIRAKNVELQGKAEGCLGIFYQHINRLPDAEPLLAASVSHLRMSASDAVVIRAHLTALQRGISCGCNNLEETFYENYCAAIREQVEAEMPGLLEDISFAQDEGGIRSLQVKIAREPSQPELERLQIVVTQAEAAFRQKVRERR